MLYTELISRLEKIRPKYCKSTQDTITLAVKAIEQLLTEREDLLDRLEKQRGIY